MIIAKLQLNHPISNFHEQDKTKLLAKFKNVLCAVFRVKRWLKTVSNTYIWIGRYNHCLSFDATIMVSKTCPIIGEHVVIIFLTQ